MGAVFYTPKEEKTHEKMEKTVLIAILVMAALCVWRFAHSPESAAAAFRWGRADFERAAAQALAAGSGGPLYGRGALPPGVGYRGVFFWGGGGGGIVHRLLGGDVQPGRAGGP